MWRSIANCQPSFFFEIRFLSSPKTSWVDPVCTVAHKGHAHYSIEHYQFQFLISYQLPIWIFQFKVFSSNWDTSMWVLFADIVNYCRYQLCAYTSVLWSTLVRHEHDTSSYIIISGRPFHWMTVLGGIFKLKINVIMMLKGGGGQQSGIYFFHCHKYNHTHQLVLYANDLSSHDHEDCTVSYMTKQGYEGDPGMPAWWLLVAKIYLGFHYKLRL